jgi:FkbM family methyltransferase
VGWYDRDWAELPEIALARRFRLRPAARVFDLGAHHGIVALMLARIVGPLGQVIAVEASPHNAALCSRNRDLNDAQQLTVVQAAVSDQPGRLFFNQGCNGQIDDGSGDWGRIEVPAVTIDGLAEKHGQPDMLFLDVEGVECQALNGARQVLASYPDCCVEVHVGEGLEKFGGSVGGVLEFFPAQVYDRFVHTEAHLEPCRLEQTDSACLRSRFFLTAIHRGSRGTQSGSSAAIVQH